jgi:hypothetical protein
VEPHGQEPVAPLVRRNPPKLQSSFAKASEGTRIPPQSGDHGFGRRRVDVQLSFILRIHHLSCQIYVVARQAAGKVFKGLIAEQSQKKLDPFIKESVL